MQWRLVVHHCLTFPVQGRNIDRCPWARTVFMIYSKGDAMRVSRHPEARNMSPSWSNKTRKFIRFLCIFFLLCQQDDKLEAKRKSPKTLIVALGQDFYLFFGL